MVTTGGNKPSVQKGVGGWLDMVKIALVITTMNGAFGGSPIFNLFYGRLLTVQQRWDQYCRSNILNLPVRVQALQAGTLQEYWVIQDRNVRGDSEDSMRATKCLMQRQAQCRSCFD
jgi:hypothetical protein